MELIKIDHSNIYLISTFLKIAGKSITTFRYFNTRSLDVIKNHVITYVLSLDDNIIAYGHLDRDRDGETIWLGIAVAESYQGKGMGKIMISYLIEYARQNSISRIDLSVDSFNEIAQKLYNSMGFIKYNIKDNILYYKLIL